jgi:hypothetical protein
MSIHDVIVTSMHDVIVPLLTALAPFAWPVTVLILVLAFHGSIRRLLGLIKRLKIGDNAVEFGEAPSDRLFPKLDEKSANTEATKQLARPSGPQWQNVGNVFWLGGDLIATAQTTLRGAPKESIRKALAQACHHISELGLAGSAPATELSLLQTELASLPETSLGRDWRITFSARIYDVTRMMDDLLRKQQPGYRPNP